MIDTLGINARSLSAFVLYQQSKKESDYKRWLRTLQSERASELLGEKLLLSEVDKLIQGVEVLEGALQKGEVRGIHEKLEKCHQLLARDVSTLRERCAGMQRIIDAHTDALAIASAPLSAEQLSLQQDLRQSSTEMQSKLTELERGVTQLRAGLADASRPEADANGQARPRPTVEAVTSTINTMTTMAEKKSGDVDMLEAQIRKLGIDVSRAPSSHSPARNVDGSPFQTPQKQIRFPLSPGSRDLTDGGSRSAYHTPESSGRFRTSLLGRSTATALVLPDDASQWREKSQRKKEIAGQVRTALGSRKVKVRASDA
jgi:nucleoporin NUP159